MKYPQNMLEFIDLFATEEQCLAYLEEIRWGGVCPKCSSDKYWRHGKRRARICAGCKSTLCVTAGTVLHRARISLRTLFLIAWFMIISKQGISAEELAVMLSISTKTAWLWNHKFRKIMVLDDRTKLSGNVEVDEVFIGGKQEGTRGRGAKGKLKVVMAVEINMTQQNKKGLFRGMGRIRMKIIPNCGEKTLTKFIEENVEKDSTLYTDGWLGYKNIDKHGYKHIIESESVVDDEIIGINAQEVTPNVHIVASLVKRWLLGTHQQYLTQDGYLQDYLEEYTFRFNRRKSSNRGKLFNTLLEQIMTHKPTLINQIKDSTGGKKNGMIPN